MNVPGEVPTPAQPGPRVRQIAWAVIVAATAAFLLVAAGLAVSFPSLDDYQTGLDYLCQFRAADLGGKLRLLVAQHNEHRILFSRLVELICFHVQGRLDFRTIILIGDLGLVTMCAVLVAGAQRTISKAGILALIPLVLLSALQGRQMIWATAALENYWAMAFAVGALWLLTAGDKKSFAWSCVLAVVATYTSGQGLIGFVAGGAVLLVQQRWKRLQMWLVVFMVVAVPYFWGYVRPVNHPPMELSLRAIQFFPMVVGGAVSEFFNLLLAPLIGHSGFAATVTTTLQMVCGVALLGACGLLGVTGYYRRNLFVSVTILYLLMLCGAGAVTRSGFGMGHASMSHYKVISGSLAVMVVVALLDLRQSRVKESWILAAAAGLGVACWLLFLPQVTGFADELARHREAFLRDQTLQIVAERETWMGDLRILWRSYLTGVLPLGELTRERPAKIPVDVLTGIAGERKETDSAIASDAKVVATLSWAGDQLWVGPVATSQSGDATVIFSRGELWYMLPARGSAP